MNRHASRLLAMARRWLGVDARDRTLDAELESFLQHEIDARIDEGMTPGEARRTALASIGGIQQVKERARDARTGAWVDALWRDTRYAVRIFRRSPDFAATAVVSLAVGIAAATGVFSIVNAALLNPFPFADINRIVRLDVNDKGKPRGLSVTARQLVALQHSDVFDGTFAWNTWEMTLTAHGLPETVQTQYFFSKRFERTRGSAPPRTSLSRGGRAGGRAAPTGRRAHLSVLAATLRRAA